MVKDALHFWDLADGKHLQTVDLESQYQMVLELRPSHDPEATWGFVGVVVSTDDLSASVWRRSRQDGTRRADKVITIPDEPRPPAPLAGIRQGVRSRPGRAGCHSSSTAVASSRSRPCW